MYATIFLSRYRPAPRKGHLEKIRKLCGYLKKFTSTSIKFNIEMPAYEIFKMIEGRLGNLYYG